MNDTLTHRWQRSSAGCVPLEFRLTRSRRLYGTLLLVAAALILSVVGIGDLDLWQRFALGAALLAAAAGGASPLLPRAPAASVSCIALDNRHAATACRHIRLRLRDGVERRATLSGGSLVLPSLALLVCRLDPAAMVLGPGQRLPRRVVALLFAAEQDPRAWRLLHWHLRWPVRDAAMH